MDDYICAIWLIKFYTCAHYIYTDIQLCICFTGLQPERINPVETGAKYDQRSDVWSYGITVVSVHALIFVIKRGFYVGVHYLE